MPDDALSASETPTAAFRRGDHERTVQLLLEERKEHRQQFTALAKDVGEIKAVMVGDMTGTKPGLGARVTALEEHRTTVSRFTWVTITAAVTAAVAALASILRTR